MVELFADAAYHEVLMRLAETPEERSKHKYMYENAAKLAQEIQSQDYRQCCGYYIGNDYWSEPSGHFHWCKNYKER